jgi:hypothetical protein
MMNRRRYGRKQSLPNRGAIPEFAWGDWSKPRKPSVRIASVRIEAPTVYLQRASVEGYSYSNLLGRFLFCSFGEGVRLSDLSTSASGGPLVPAPDGDNYECGTIGGMRIGWGNWRSRRNCIPMLICVPQVPHALNLDQIQAAAVESRWLTAWSMARSSYIGHFRKNSFPKNEIKQ